MRISPNASRRAGPLLAAAVLLCLSAACCIGQGGSTGAQSNPGKQADRETKQANPKAPSGAGPGAAKHGPEPATDKKASAQEHANYTSAEAFNAMIKAILALDAENAKAGGSELSNAQPDNQNGGKGGSEKKDPIATSYEELITAVLNQPGVKVTVRKISVESPPHVGAITAPNAAASYVAVLTGKMTSEDDSNVAMKRLDTLLTTAKLDDVILVNVLDAGIAKHHDHDVSHLWQCGFIQGDADFDAKVKLQNVADALNFLLPHENGQQPYVTVKDTNLWLQGPLSRVQAIRAMLAMIDAPQPQVRLEVWAIQYAGSQKDVGDRMVTLSDEIAQTQRGAELARRSLAYAIRKNAETINKDLAFKDLNSVGFIMDPNASDSLIECLWCIGVCKNRSAILHQAIDALKAQIPNLAPWLTDGLKSDKTFFPNLTQLLDPGNSAAEYDTLSADQLTIQQFALSLKQYIAFVDAVGLYGPPKIKGDPDQILLDYPAAPETMSRLSLAVDRQLEQLVNAYSADMEQMFFAPLLARAQKWSYGGGQGGVGLAGKSTIAVTSRFQADVTPSLQAYGERQMPRQLGSQFINSLSPPPGSTATPAASPPVTIIEQDPGKGYTTVGAAPTSGSSAASGPPPSTAATLAAGFQKLAATLTPAERAGMLAALQPPADISYYSVAPGIAIHVTPTMTPDGTSADLKLDVCFGIDTNTQSSNLSGPNAYRPPDAVKSDHVVTQANVGGFNLFEVSSFNMDTQYPRPPFITPVLGNLPIVGNMFHFGRGTNRTYHQSIILVNATLIPRSMGLVGFYGANFAGSTAVSLELSKQQGGGIARGANTGPRTIDRTKTLTYDTFLTVPSAPDSAKEKPIKTP